MTDETRMNDAKWVETHVTRFADDELQARYSVFARTLSAVLNKASKKAAPLAIVQARVKAVDSFAEKILRKRSLYEDPVNDMTDLCGARVITHTAEQVQAVSDFIETHLDVDWDNSDDTSGRLRTTEFGYRSVHYIVRFKEDVFPTADVPLEVPEEAYGLWAEIQVRTILEHAWADIAHDLTYKSPFKVPAPFLRRVAGLAARLEGVSGEISRIHEDLQVYGAHYGTYIEKDQAEAELDTLALLLALGGNRDVKLAAKIGRLANTIGDWKRAADTLESFDAERHRPARRELGKALCRTHPVGSDGWLEGQEHLAYASSDPEPDLEALVALAQSHQDMRDDKEASRVFRAAFEMDATEPDCLRHYLEFEMTDRKTAEPARLAGPVIRNACDRCHKQIVGGVNLFGAYSNLALFHLWLQEPEQGFLALVKAIEVATARYQLEAAHRSLLQLERVQPGFRGYDWLYRLVLLGLAVRYGDKRALKTLRGMASQGRDPIEGPVVILAGGTAPEVEGKVAGYRELIVKAFEDFSGTLISGGTTAGVAGLAGDVGASCPSARTIGYRPRHLDPAVVRVDRDTARYRDVRVTDEEDFSPLQPVQYWIDILASGIEPRDVRLVGINGGAVSGAEYRMALAMGADVGMIEDSGREAVRIFGDPDWKDHKNLVTLIPDAATLQVFMVPGMPWPLGDREREQLARVVHENFSEKKKKDLVKKNKNTQPWEKLHETFKRANFGQVDHIVEKLRIIGCDVDKADPSAPEFAFTAAELEKLAKLEHGRWNLDRIRDGWRYAEAKDEDRKLTPYLVPWDALSEEIQGYDYDPVKEIPDLLARVNLRIVRRGED